MSNLIIILHSYYLDYIDEILSKSIVYINNYAS